MAWSVPYLSHRHCLVDDSEGLEPQTIRTTDRVAFIRRSAQPSSQHQSHPPRAANTLKPAAPVHRNDAKRIAPSPVRYLALRPEPPQLPRQDVFVREDVALCRRLSVLRPRHGSSERSSDRAAPPHTSSTVAPAARTARAPARASASTPVAADSARIRRVAGDIDRHNSARILPAAGSVSSSGRRAVD